MFLLYRYNETRVYGSRRSPDCSTIIVRILRSFLPVKAKIPDTPSFLFCFIFFSSYSPCRLISFEFLRVATRARPFGCSLPRYQRIRKQHSHPSQILAFASLVCKQISGGQPAGRVAARTAVSTYSPDGGEYSPDSGEYQI